MFWDKTARFYDFFMRLKNGRANQELCHVLVQWIAPEDSVLECACGTGMISCAVAPHCKSLVATDFSAGMRKQTQKKCRSFPNVSVQDANILELPFADASFDKVIAGNVIHLLDTPQTAIQELLRVCKPGGLVIVPTYVNCEQRGKPSLFVRVLSKIGAGFQQQFRYAQYQEFFAAMQLRSVQFSLVDGNMPCAIACIPKSSSCDQ